MLKLQGSIDLPPHPQPGGFDHAAVHLASHRLFVAHTANDAIDIIDTAVDRYIESLPGLTGVAGALVYEKENLLFTSNRGENTVGILALASSSPITKVPVDLRPNGLAYDPIRRLLLAAHVGDPAIPASYTLGLVDIDKKQKAASIPVPGRTRWAVFDPLAEVFYVNISYPAQILVIDPRKPDRISRHMDVPAEGPHGLDLEIENRRLYCACDGKQLLAIHPEDGQILLQAALGGTPDVIFLNPTLDHLYVAIGDPGIIEVYAASTLARIQTIQTERGAHTIGFDPSRNKVYAFLPQRHQAAVFIDQE
jgi:DNA-binding beta-propeller fold protein YncE